jgi:hypothetical protein
VIEDPARPGTPNNEEYSSDPPQTSDRKVTLPPLTDIQEVHESISEVVEEGSSGRPQTSPMIGQTTERPLAAT